MCSESAYSQRIKERTTLEQWYCLEVSDWTRRASEGFCSIFLNWRLRPSKKFLWICVFVSSHTYSVPVRSYKMTEEKIWFLPDPTGLCATRIYCGKKICSPFDSAAPGSVMPLVSGLTSASFRQPMNTGIWDVTMTAKAVSSFIQAKSLWRGEQITNEATGADFRQTSKY